MTEYTELLAKANSDVESNPKYAAAYRRRGILKMENEDYEGGIEDFTIALRLKKKHALTWYYRGICHYFLDSFLCARYDYSMALKIRPNMSDVLCELGRISFEECDYSQAFTYLNKSLKINGKCFDALTLRGYMRMKTGTLVKAEKDLNRALNIKPFDSQARLFRAMTFQKSERWTEALEDFDLAISLHPVEIAYLNRAVVKMQLAQYQAALDDARDAMKLSCDLERCFKLIEEIEERMGI